MGGPFGFAVLFAFALLLIRPASAQVVTGTPPFGSFGGGPFDTINLSNLNVHFAIPILNKAGAGLPFNYALTYDNSIWYPSSSSGSNTWTPVVGWGWNSVSDGATGYLEEVVNPTLCYYQGLYYHITYYTFGPYYDAQGTSHAVSVQTTTGQSSCNIAPVTGGTNLDPAGSGYTLVVSGTVNAAIKSAGGVTINPYIWQGGSYTTPQGSVVDPNGNTISSSYNSSTTTTTFTDTLNTIALTVYTPAPASANTTFSYTNPQGNTSTPFTMKYTQYTLETNFGCSNIVEYGKNQQQTQYLVSEIDLPDSTKYTFSYEPTPNPVYQGAVTGRLATVTLPTGGKISYTYTGGSSGITCTDGTTATLQRETPDTGYTGSTYWKYAHIETGTGWTTTITDPQTNVATYYFQQIAGTQYAYETERVINQGSSSPLVTVATRYNYGGNITYPFFEIDVHTTFPSALVSWGRTLYNSYSQPTEIDAYDYLSNTALRKTTFTYDINLYGIYIYDRPLSVYVYDNAGSLKAGTTYTYDAYGNKLSATYATKFTATVTQNFNHNSNGTLNWSEDFNGNKTAYTYGTGSCINAFPTKVTLPNNLYMSYAYDTNCAGGVLASSTDVNGKTTTYSYNDPNHFWRLVGVSYPDGGSKTITYTDAANAFSVSTSTAVASGKSHQITQLLDGLGRPYQAQDKSAATYVDTVYDTLGQVYSVSNPYYTKSDTTYGVTTYSYDALGRTTSVQAPGGATATTSYAAGTSTYCTTVTDPASKVRQLCADGMGRVTSVTEDPGSSPHLNYQTTYTYDPLNNLLSVTQGSQVRSYMYDYLSRLFWATTPEQGNTYICYTSSTSACSPSDSSTTLCSGSASTPCRRTDARGITTTYTYDAMNRITGKSYSNSNPTATAYTYDQTGCLGLSVSCYNKGRRTTMTDASGSTEWAYDSMGRVLMEQRTIGSVTKNIAYTYNLDGSASTITYPSGRTITYTVSAAQQPLSAVDTTNNVNYVLNATYAPQGAVAGALLGESGSFGGITYAATYTNRLLPYTATATSSAANALNLAFAYYANGNVETITNNLNTVRTESFTYDNLNRVATAQSQATSGTYCWGQSFGYDRYGNLGTVTATSCTPPTLNLSINTNNQITNSGYAYDASGDLTSDGTYTYTWDARHRLQSAGGVTYTYDGDGKRVMKSSGTLYWNSADGTPLAETNSSGTTLNEYIFFNANRVARRDSSGNVYYYFQDHLGTTKTLTTSAGVVCYDADFTPFGYENAHITTCSQNYKFTGLERDSETGLDHTLHRKYDSNLGRWLTPDTHRGNALNPQSWNRYAYVLNNPVSAIDPSGLCSQPPTLSLGQIGVCVDLYIPTYYVPGGNWFVQGIGDNRGPSANGGTFREEVNLIYDSISGVLQSSVQAGLSQAVVAGAFDGGFTVGQPGGVVGNISPEFSDSSVLVNIDTSALNGFAGWPGAPTDPIDMNLSLTIGSNGTVSVLPGSTYSGYPSLEIWTYQTGQDPNQLTDVPAGNISQLGTNNTPIPPTTTDEGGSGGGGVGGGNDIEEGDDGESPEQNAQSNRP